MLSELQTKKFTAAFHVSDLNQSGALEWDDFRLFIENVANIRGWEEDSADYQAFKTAQTNQWEALLQFDFVKSDGQISLEEFLAVYELLVMLAQDGQEDELAGEIVRLLFDIVDTDGDGVISLTEYAQMFDAYNLPFDEVEVVFRHLDLDGDGRLSKEEYILVVKDFYFGDDPDAPGNWLMGQLD